ncbi:MAG: molecular chaperone DnaJ [Clostridia bacterium]
MANKDYYASLGVDKNTSADEIKSAYRRKAKLYHPDKFAAADDAKKKEAEEKFKEVQHAYDILSDPQKKAAYDQYGSEDGPMAGGGAGSGFGGFDFSGAGGFGDIFSDIFSSFTGGGGSGSRSSRRARVVDGDDIELILDLTFKEACFGVNSKLVRFTRIETCPTCNGTGAKDPMSIQTCPKCHGTGRIVVNQRTPFGVMQSERACDQCEGTGKIIKEKCVDCHGKGRIKKVHEVKVNIPAGVENGQMLTMRGEGSVSPEKGGSNGNLILKFRVATHLIFTRDGVNLSFVLPITIFQATLGDKVQIPTLDKPVAIDIPAGTQNDTVIRVKGKGVKYLRKDAFGDLYVKVLVEVPVLSSIKEKKDFKDMANQFDKAKYDRINRFNKNLRDID